MIGTAIRRRVAATLFAVVAAAVMLGIAATVGAPTAEAHDHRIPKTVLKRADLRSRIWRAET